jgi:hypothetical protein
MSDKTPGQEASEEARRACDKLTDHEKERLRLDALRYMDVAGVAIRESHLLRLQRDRAIRIADEALANGHASHCTYEEGKYRCRCGVQELERELRELKSQIG